MTRSTSRIAEAAVAASLVAAIGVSGLWIARRQFDVGWPREIVTRTHPVVGFDPEARCVYVGLITPAESWPILFVYSLRGRFGFRYFEAIAAAKGDPDRNPVGHYRGIQIPAWAAVPALLAPAGLRTIAFIRRRRGARVGLCPDCGYDLRASPDRCPECGRVVTP